MINVWIPAQRKFWKYYKECKELYEILQDKITDDSSFEYIIENSGTLDDLADAAHLLLEDLTK